MPTSEDYTCKNAKTNVEHELTATHVKKLKTDVEHEH